MEIESFKVSAYMQATIRKFLEEYKIKKSDFFRRAVMDAMKSEKLNAELREMVKYNELEQGLIEGDMMVKMSLKKASLVENYSRLLKSLKGRKMTQEHYDDVRTALLNRIKKVFGQDSKEYKYCEKRHREK